MLCLHLRSLPKPVVVEEEMCIWDIVIAKEMESNSSRAPLGTPELPGGASENVGAAVEMTRCHNETLYLLT